MGGTVAGSRSRCRRQASPRSVVDTVGFDDEPLQPRGDLADQSETARVPRRDRPGLRASGAPARTVPPVPVTHPGAGSGLSPLEHDPSGDGDEFIGERRFR